MSAETVNCRQYSYGLCALWVNSTISSNLCMSFTESILCISKRFDQLQCWLDNLIGWTVKHNLSDIVCCVLWEYVRKHTCENQRISICEFDCSNVLQKDIDHCNVFSFIRSLSLKLLSNSLRVTLI